MRVVEINDLTEGMIIGKTIFALNGGILLRKGVLLKQPLIDTIKHTDLVAVYIDDEFSKGIEPTEIIDEQFRQRTVQKIKTFFTMPSNKMTARTINTFHKEMDKVLTGIIEQVLDNHDSLLNLVTLKSHDDYTFQHSVNVAVISTVLGTGLGFDKDSLVELVKGAIFHDLGKMMISKEILNKPGKLTDEEFLRMKQHPTLGFGFAKSTLDLTLNSLLGIMQHHEKYNGEGYPASRAGKDIHLYAQIIAIADVFDAITSKRTYHEAKLPNEAVEYFISTSGRHFAKEIVDLFLSKVAVFPIGSVVELSNGMKGVIYSNAEGSAMRPVVKIFTSDTEMMYVDLAHAAYGGITITKMVI